MPCKSEDSNAQVVCVWVCTYVCCVALLPVMVTTLCRIHSSNVLACDQLHVELKELACGVCTGSVYSMLYD